MKALRNIVIINEDKCDGCGQCVLACHEGALEIIDGKAKLVGEILCDGFGDCIGECPQGALTIEKREVEQYDEKAVKEHVKKKEESEAPLPCGCPGSSVQDFSSRKTVPAGGGCDDPPAESALGHWPVQIMLVPPNAGFLRNADLLITADCVPFALPDLHRKYLPGRVALVGCPKFDDNNFYMERFKEIFRTTEPKSITVLRMQVPCCGGLARLVIMARDEAAPHLPLKIITVAVEGGVMREDEIPPAA